jgi:hypothetical protein
MTEYGTNIETILNIPTDKFADRVLLLGQVTEKKEKALPSHFLKFLFSQPHKRHIGFCPNRTKPTLRQKPKSRFFSTPFFGSSELITIFVNLFR